MSKQPFITIVIPTRNRPELALIAAESARHDQSADMQIIVSDNSDIDLKEKLKKSIEDLDDNRINYISPAHVMSMAEHWEWAVAQAQGEYVAVLSDRSVFKKNSLGFIRDILREKKVNVLSYIWDSLGGTAPPYIYTQRSYTNKVYKFESKYFIKLASRAIVTHAYPRMLNCFVSNKLLKDIRKEVGQISASLAPDYAFCFRILDSTKEIYFYDYPAFIVHGDSVSNGFNYSRNTGSETVKDFFSLAEKNIEKFAPIHSPLSHVPFNVEMLEYNYAMKNQKSGHFTPLNNQEFYIRSFAKASKLSSDGVDMTQVFNLLDNYAAANNLSKLRYVNKKITKYRSKIFHLLKNTAFITLDNLAESQRTFVADIFNIKKAVKFFSIDEAILYEQNHPKKTADRLDRKSLFLL